MNNNEFQTVGLYDQKAFYGEVQQQLTNVKEHGMKMEKDLR